MLEQNFQKKKFLLFLVHYHILRTHIDNFFLKVFGRFILNNIFYCQVNRGYTERHSRWLQCSENWRTLQKTVEEFTVWLNTIEEKVQTTASQPLAEAKMTQKELEKQVTLKHR